MSFGTLLFDLLLWTGVAVGLFAIVRTALGYDRRFGDDE